MARDPATANPPTKNWTWGPSEVETLRAENERLRRENEALRAAVPQPTEPRP